MRVRKGVGWGEGGREGGGGGRGARSFNGIIQQFPREKNPRFFLSRARPSPRSRAPSLVIFPSLFLVNRPRHREISPHPSIPQRHVAPPTHPIRSLDFRRGKFGGKRGKGRKGGEGERTVGPAARAPAALPVTGPGMVEMRRGGGVGEGDEEEKKSERSKTHVAPRGAPA